MGLRVGGQYPLRLCVAFLPYGSAFHVVYGPKVSLPLFGFSNTKMAVSAAWLFSLKDQDRKGTRAEGWENVCWHRSIGAELQCSPMGTSMHLFGIQILSLPHGTLFDLLKTYSPCFWRAGSHAACSLH